MNLIVLLLATIPVIFCDWSLEPKQIDYRFQYTECKNFNKKFGYKVLCPYKFVNRSSQINSLEFYIHPGMKIDKVFIELSTHKKFGTVYRPFMITLKENFCDVVANKSNSFYAQQLRLSLQQSNTNFLEPCPFTGKKYRYGQHEPTIGFPPLLPIGFWKVFTKLTTFTNGMEEFLVELVDVWEVAQKTATQF